MWTEKLFFSIGGIYHKTFACLCKPILRMATSDNECKLCVYKTMKGMPKYVSIFFSLWTLMITSKNDSRSCPNRKT